MGWAKHYFLLLFLILLIVQITYAENLNCEYTKLEEDSVPKRVLVYENSDVKGGEVLNFSDFTEGEVATFIIKNPNDFKVMVVLTYSIGVRDLQYGKWIEANKAIQIRDFCSLGQDGANCSINQESLNYYVAKPQIMYPKIISIKENKTVCDGKDNGTICTNDNECGSRECNIAELCGEFKHCQEGTINCSGIDCLSASTKSSGETYYCEWECGNNTIPCNGVCREVSSKKWRQEYHCVEECKSQRGENGVCMLSVFWAKLAIIFYGILIFIGVSYVGYFIVWKKVIPLIKRYIEAKKNLGKIKTEIDKIKNKKVKLDEEFSDLKEKYDRKKENITNSYNAEIEELRRKKENADVEAENIINKKIEDKKKDYDCKLEKIKGNFENENEVVKKNKEALEQERKELEKIMDKQKTIKIELDGKYNELDEKYMKELESRYGKGKISINDGYPIFSDTKIRIHRYFYKAQYEEKYGQPFDETNVIHHIDVNRKNSLNFWNLIDITPEEHKKINHSKINRGDWNQGLKVIMDCFGWEESDLPKHIREHLNKTKKKSRLSFKHPD